MDHHHHAVRFTFTFDVEKADDHFSGWSVCTIAMGFVHNYEGLMAARVFLGICEGGLFPGVTYYITMW